jgi:XTP/dITP diphosphohydrolase
LPSGLGALPLRKLVLATTNKGKLQEIRELLAGLPLIIVGLDDYQGLTAIEETGRTFVDNAIIKAKTVAEFTKELTLADDSLGGAPGVYSARYGQPGWNSRQQYQYLLEELAGCGRPSRSARFRCAIALYDPATMILETEEGTVEGEITDQPRGDRGFGYDPVFYLPELGRTMAELSDSQKNRLSHRGRALAAIKPKILQIMADGQ